MKILELYRDTEKFRLWSMIFTVLLFFCYSIILLALVNFDKLELINMKTITIVILTLSCVFLADIIVTFALDIWELIMKIWDAI